MLDHLFKKDCTIKRPVTTPPIRDKEGKFNLDAGTAAKIKDVPITEREITIFNLTMNNTAFLIKGIDTIPVGSKLVFNGKTYDLEKIKTLRNIHDVEEGFKVFV